MENARKIALGFTLFFAIIAGIRVYLIHRERVEANATADAPVTAHYKINDDDLVLPRQLYPSSMQGELRRADRGVSVPGPHRFRAP